MALLPQRRQRQHTVKWHRWSVVRLRHIVLFTNQSFILIPTSTITDLSIIRRLDRLCMLRVRITRARRYTVCHLVVLTTVTTFNSTMDTSNRFIPPVVTVPLGKSAGRSMGWLDLLLTMQTAPLIALRTGPFPPNMTRQIVWVGLNLLQIQLFGGLISGDADLHIGLTKTFNRFFLHDYECNIATLYL